MKAVKNAVRAAEKLLEAVLNVRKRSLNAKSGEEFRRLINTPNFIERKEDSNRKKVVRLSH
jgi:hypothetical protein